MDTITYTSARSDLANTRKTSQSVVMMPLEDYEALEETAYLLRSPKNARRLLESIVELEKGKGVEREIID